MTYISHHWVFNASPRQIFHSSSNDAVSRHLIVSLAGSLLLSLHGGTAASCRMRRPICGLISNCSQILLPISHAVGVAVGHGGISLIGIGRALSISLVIGVIVSYIVGAFLQVTLLHLLLLLPIALITNVQVSWIFIL